MTRSPPPNLADRKAALHAEIAARARKLRASMGAPRRRRWGFLLLPALLLLLLARPCQPTAPVPPPAPAPPAPLPAAERAPSAPGTPSVPLQRLPRPAWEPEDPGPLPWVDALQVQVAARGPRLSACFVGVPRPGALRWTALVEPLSGRVSDAVLEPVLATDALTRDQRVCALEVLADPVYRLPPGGQERSTPVKVGVMVEF